TDAANKNYVDNLQAGLSWKDSVRIATTADHALSGLTAIDGVTPIAGDRILVKNQTTGSANGIYTAAAGAWTRATDADTGPELVAAAAYVEEGTTLGDTAWVQTVSPITINVTGLTWSQFSGGGSVTAGAGMTQSGNVLNVVGDATMTVGADSLGVADDGITNAKLANMPATTIKGNSTGGSNNPTDLTQQQVATLLGGFLGRMFAVNLVAATAQNVTHNFGTRDVQAQVFRNATPWDSVECDIERADLNFVTVRFAVAPTLNEYRAVVMG
ncbi:MAG TPA: hypothetical protein VFP09_10980, partial [Desertimonas sp.]|nr:hypothetical protein [Desertimonas sp.]